MKKEVALLFLQVILLPLIIVYLTSKNKQDIIEDLEVAREKYNCDYGNAKTLVFLLYSNKYYRNVFYSRIGKVSCLFYWILPRAKDFYPCENLGGGIYCAHPYATILNAKKIGKHLSVRQCTTIGNKFDGEGVNGPVLGDNVFLGANVCIIGDITIGDNVIVGAGSVVVKDIPNNVVVAGNPARIIKERELM